MNQQIQILVEVPIASFRQSRAREYAETYPVPPPSTVYGMLLSMVGEVDRYKHCGVELAIAMLSQPERSTVIRTFRRFKNKEISHPTNAKPDYQELLTDIQFVVAVLPGHDPEPCNLVERLNTALTQPQQVDRFGGLSLGESRDLVNSVQILQEVDPQRELSWLVQSEDGLLTLPYWVDHVGSKKTRWRRYLQQDFTNNWQIPDLAWTMIQPN